MKREYKHSEILNQIRIIYLKSGRTYGSPRVHAALRLSGYKCSLWLVEKLMREYNLRSRLKKKFKKSYSVDIHCEIPNILKRKFNPDKPNKIWASDVTFIWTKEGWLHLCVTLDLFSRLVVGWQMADKVDTQLTLQSLQMAIFNRKINKKLIHHSDQGKEFAAREYRRELSNLGITQSMSRRGNCWDNAAVESFFHTLKSEMEGVFSTREEARAWCFYWIEVYYNRQRLHSTLGYLPPVLYEKRMVA